MSRLTQARERLTEASDEYLRDRLLGAVAALKLIGGIENSCFDTRDALVDSRDDLVAAIRYLGISMNSDLLELKANIDAARSIIDDIQARSPLPVVEGGAP